MKEIIENKVHACRLERGLTQEEVAERVGVSRQTVIAIERGHYAPSVLLALKLARLFREPVETLFRIKYEK